MQDDEAPAPSPPDVLDAALGLRYCDFLTVAVSQVDGEDLFPDNWLYIHDPLQLRVGRIQ